MCCMVTISMLFMCLLGSGQSYELPGPGILRSLKKTVTGSSQHPELTSFALSFAVDGSTSRDSSLCRCCASTQIQNDPWIQIDLGRLYRVETVEVIGRKDFDDSFNMVIFVSTTNTILQGNTPTQPTLPDVPEQYHNVTFSYPVIGQFVTLQLNGNVGLCVCEVNIYSKDCSNGTYGLYCNETCGQCQDRETCDFVTGRCTRCIPGYQLPLCTEDALISLNANVTASSTNPHSKFALSRAVDGSTSMNSTACKCCAATKPENQPWIQINLGRLYRVATVKVVSRTDWQDGDCNPGTYGFYCNETCGQFCNGEICDHVTGVCTQCLPGYQFPLCKKECLPGSFGTNCLSTCHCQHNLTCNHLNGSCLEGCGLGWFGSNCSQECPPGAYGLGCNKTCGKCQDNQTCHHVTGNCMQCTPGYQFPLCKETATQAYKVQACGKLHLRK